MEGICSHLVIIRFGTLLYSGPMADLLDRAGHRVTMAPEHDDDTNSLREALSAAGWSVTVTAPGALEVLADENAAAQVNRDAISAGITLRSLSIERETLESIFLEMTGTDDAELSASRAAAANAHHNEKKANR